MKSIYNVILGAVTRTPGPHIFTDVLHRRWELRREDELPMLVGLTPDTPTLRGSEMLGLHIQGLRMESRPAFDKGE